MLTYGIAGAALIFCGLYIHSLEKTNKELLELNKELLENNRKSLEISQEMLDYLNGLDDDTDPDGGEKMAMGHEEKPKGEIVAFQSREAAS